MSRRTRAQFLYIVLAYGITWSVWLPFLRAHLSGGSGPSPYVYYLGGFGPLLAALAAEAYERGSGGIADLLLRLVDWHRPRWWTLVGLLSPLLLIPLTAAPLRLAGQDWPAWRAFGVTGRAPGLGPLATWLLMILSYGIGEETGWRGFLLPRLQTQRSALAATLRLTVIWAGWHVPAFWFREGYVGLGAVGLIGFLIGLGAGAVLLTALYNASKGSILAVALWHGTWNWVATSDALQGPWVAAMTMLLIILAPVIIWRWGGRDLAPRPRPTVGPAEDTA
jgi:CAAX protease family protein